MSPQQHERQMLRSKRPLARFGFKSKAFALQNTASADVNRGAIIPSKDVKRIQMERHYSPYRSTEMHLQDMLLDKTETPTTCCIVYVRSFTNSGHDFVYCVPELTRLSKFYGGTYGARDYQGSVIGTLIVLAGAVIERVGPIDWRSYKKVPKCTENINDVRWRYLFATAKRAWSMMLFYASQLPVLEAVLADVPVQHQKPEPEAQLPNPISDSDYPPEARAIAVHQNVELLKKKPNHQDRVFEYLERELIGWCSRHRKRELTKHQYRLVARLRDNADDFFELYNDEEYDGNTVPSPDFSKEEEAHLISERDIIIQEIQEQLVLPISVRNSPDDPDLPGLEPYYTPCGSKDTKDSSSSDEDNLRGQPMDMKCPTTQQANLIEKFADFTGAKLFRCEGYLHAANWDMDLALSYFQEDETRSEPSVVHDTNSTGPAERVAAVTTFKDLTNADSAIAASYLTSTDWDLGRAVSAFFDDGEAAMKDSKDSYGSANTVYSKSSANIGKKPMERNSSDMSNSMTRSIGEQAIMSASLKVSIRQRIAELDAQINKINNQLEEMDDEGFDTIMQDVAESEKGFNEDSELYAAPGGKLLVIDEDPSPVVTSRKGISHAGLPLELDEAGNVIWYKRPTGTPYEQYLAMRSRLQVQHYGYEAILSDEDSHRGIPIRERCSAPFVQEEVNDFSSASSSDDNIIPPKSKDPSASPKTANKATRMENRSAALKERADLMDMLMVSGEEVRAKVAEEAGPVDTSTRLGDQQDFNWGEQVVEAIRVVKWQDLTKGEEGEEVDSVLRSADENEAVNPGQTVPIKPALRDTSQPRRPSMNVRFNLNGEDHEMPTLWLRPIDMAEEKRPRRGRSRLKHSEESETLDLEDFSDAVRDEKHISGTRKRPPSKPVREQVGKEKGTQSARTEDNNVDADAEKKTIRKWREEEAAQKKRALFISNQEDAWDGLDSDEGQSELESGSDIDAEGETESDIDAESEENSGYKHEHEVEAQQEKDKRPPRVDEKMED